MNDSAPTLADGLYSYSKPGMHSVYTVTAQPEGGRPILGTVNGEAMSGTFWHGITLADFACLPHTFTPAPQPIGKARACRLHKILSRLGLGHADHYRAASAAFCVVSNGRIVPRVTAGESTRRRFMAQGEFAVIDSPAPDSHPLALAL